MKCRLPDFPARDASTTCGLVSVAPVTAIQTRAPRGIQQPRHSEVCWSTSNQMQSMVYVCPLDSATLSFINNTDQPKRINWLVTNNKIKRVNASQERNT